MARVSKRNSITKLRLHKIKQAIANELHNDAIGYLSI